MRSNYAFPWSWRAVQAAAFASVISCLLVVYAATWERTDRYFPKALTHLADWGSGHATASLDVGIGSDDAGSGAGAENGSSDEHPIARLMRAAQVQFDALVAEHPANVVDAARRYREKRGRHPPPQFDAWFEYAKGKDALVPEAFFDQIYHDLGPFWGIDVPILQRVVRGFSPTITVRNDSVESSAPGSYEYIDQLMAILKQLGEEGVELPDMDIPVNVNNEIAMLVPWERMETAFEFSRSFTPSPHSVVSSYSSTSNKDAKTRIFDPEWLGDRLRHTSAGPHLGPRPLWSLLRPACSSDSAARKSELMADIWHPEGHTSIEHSAAALLPLDVPADTLKGYVNNWTVTSDICRRPELQGLHGAFVAPKAMSVTKKLFPLFSQSKLSVSNEILVPSTPNDDSKWATSPRPWMEKEVRLHWRGPASGGRNTYLNWRRMHRQRFVSMLNATHVEIAEGMLHAGNETTVGLGYARNFRLLPANAYNLDTQKGARMAEWISGWADVGLTDLQCDEPTEAGGCAYDDEFFSTLSASEMRFKQEREDEYKYAATLDGEGAKDDGEFLQRLLEGKVILRASIYKQWYDTRLVPWLHFVPMDHTFIDLYGIMEYFVGASIPSPVTEFPHAHVEVEKHEHNFQVPHWDDEDDGDTHKDGNVEHGVEIRSIDMDNGQKTERKDDGHDDQAQKIAEAGQQWTKKVLRRSDAMVYVYRLLLEYARVIDEKRHTIGWVGDLAEEAA